MKLTSIIATLNLCYSLLPLNAALVVDFTPSSTATAARQIPSPPYANPNDPGPDPSENKLPWDDAFPWFFQGTAGSNATVYGSFRYSERTVPSSGKPFYNANLSNSPVSLSDSHLQLTANITNNVVQDLHYTSFSSMLFWDSNDFLLSGDSFQFSDTSDDVLRLVYSYGTQNGNEPGEAIRFVIRDGSTYYVSNQGTNRLRFSANNTVEVNGASNGLKWASFEPGKSVSFNADNDPANYGLGDSLVFSSRIFNNVTGVGFLVNASRESMNATVGSRLDLVDFQAEMSAASNDGYSAPVSGDNLQGWTKMYRDALDPLADDVFQLNEAGVLHIYKDFPLGYCSDEPGNPTHAMLFTEKRYSRYILRFEYKWGNNLLNNYRQFQYDSGVFYHVTKENVWPRALEFQVRYDHVNDVNYTGDIWGNGMKFKWSHIAKRYALQSEGGKVISGQGGQYRAAEVSEVHSLDGQWNFCEIVVMGDEYAIHAVNGEVVNVITDLETKEGKIGIQAMSAEIMYRNIEVIEFEESLPIERFVGER